MCYTNSPNTVISDRAIHSHHGRSPHVHESLRCVYMQVSDRRIEEGLAEANTGFFV